MTTWPELRAIARRIDDAGFDSLWTWDHLVANIGAPGEPNFEAWQVLSAWAATTDRVRIGTLVTGVTLRHPGVLARMVATLDHVSSGRAVLGLGAGWHEGEHAAFGLPLGGARERLDRLEEAVQIVRSLLEEPRTTFRGRHYTVTDALGEPRPVQRRIPLLIGGGGEKRTMRIAARYADMWHGWGTPEVIRHKVEVLRAHCRDAGRDPDAVMPLAGAWVVVRDTTKAALQVMDRIAAAHTLPLPSERGSDHAPIAGTADEVAARLAEYREAGARGFIACIPSPFDHETVTRLATEVRPRLGSPREGRTRIPAGRPA
jgi:F420-dependent oxidoreductase-like protein